MKQVLIIDDDMAVCRTLAKIIRTMGYEAAYESTLGQGLAKAAHTSPDVVFLDVNLPDGDGIASIADFKKTPSFPEVIILTGNGTADGAEIAIKNGAWDFLQKPIQKSTIELPLKRVFQFRSEKVGPSVSTSFNRASIIGNCLEIRRSLDLAEKAAKSETNVLITGETGTGKDLFARAIHENSARAQKPFVIVDCASLPETLIESILFGHKRGAFTGADRDRDGLISQAHGGTLFLDEVAEMPLANQQRFLRVLQEKKLRPIGAGTKIESDFRLIAATNRDIDRMVQKGAFRSDLYFRLKALEITLPPLRKRMESINEIALWAVRNYCDANRLEPKGVFPEFLEALRQYDWPGNIRELISAIHAAVSNAGDEQILHPIHFPTHVRAKIAGSSVKQATRPKPALRPPRTPFPEPTPTFFQYRDASEKRYLQFVLSQTNGNINEACRLSGLSRAQLYRVMKKFDIQKDQP